jgi:hypothetical protein
MFEEVAVGEADALGEDREGLGDGSGAATWRPAPRSTATPTSAPIARTAAIPAREFTVDHAAAREPDLVRAVAIESGQRGARRRDDVDDASRAADPRAFERGAWVDPSNGRVAERSGIV